MPDNKERCQAKTKAVSLRIQLTNNFADVTVQNNLFGVSLGFVCRIITNFQQTQTNEANKKGINNNTAQQRHFPIISIFVLLHAYQFDWTQFNWGYITEDILDFIYLTNTLTHGSHAICILMCNVL